MSGYGMPQGPTPGSPRSGRTAPALPVLELVGVGLAVLAFIVAFLPWAKPDVRRGVDVDSVNGWNLALPTVATALLLVAAVLVAAPLLTKPAATADDRGRHGRLAGAGPAGLPRRAVHAGLGADPAGNTSARTSAAASAPGSGLVLGLGTAAVLVLSWLQRTGRMKKAPAAGPSNWNQGQPQGWGQPSAAPGRRATASRGPAAGPVEVDGPGAAARVRAAAVVRGAGRLTPAVHRRAAGPAAVRAGAVPAAERRLPGPGRRLLPQG